MAPLSKESLTELIQGKLRRNFGREVENATETQIFKCCALVLRDLMNTRQLETAEQVKDADARQVHYLSLEFLMEIGRAHV